MGFDVITDYRQLSAAFGPGRIAGDETGMLLTKPSPASSAQLA
jgi:hypothetical protein